jgi:hypothetical protein
MANLTITNIDNSAVIVGNAQFDDELIAFPGLDTYAEGTIMARRAVATAIVAAANGGNTGNGTVTLASVVEGDVIPKVGAYNLEVITAVANGGIFKLVDPNGAVVNPYIPMTVGAGAATIVETNGMIFTITDAGTDFIVGDKFSLTVAADGKMVVYAVAGVGGAQIPKAVLTYEVSAAGAGNVSARVMVSGEVRRDKLVIDAGGSVTDAIVDMLRSFGLVALPVDELNIQDNQ